MGPGSFFQHQSESSSVGKANGSTVVGPSSSSAGVLFFVNLFVLTSVGTPRAARVVARSRAPEEEPGEDRSKPSKAVLVYLKRPL